MTRYSGTPLVLATYSQPFYFIMITWRIYPRRSLGSSLEVIRTLARHTPTSFLLPCLIPPCTCSKNSAIFVLNVRSSMQHTNVDFCMVSFITFLWLNKRKRGQVCIFNLTTESHRVAVISDSRRKNKQTNKQTNKQDSYIDVPEKVWSPPAIKMRGCSLLFAPWAYPSNLSDMDFQAELTEWMKPRFAISRLQKKIHK